MGKTNALSGIWRTVTKSSLASGEVTLERVLRSSLVPRRQGGTVHAQAMNVDGHARRQEKNLPLLDEVVFVLMVVIGVLDDLKEGCRTVVATERRRKRQPGHHQRNRRYEYGLPHRVARNPGSNSRDTAFYSR